MTQNDHENEHGYLEEENHTDEANGPIEVARTDAPGHTRKISPHTVELYLRYVKTIRKKLLESQGGIHEREPQPVDLADWLVSNAHRFRPKTAINYRSGLLYWLNTLPETPEVHHARLILQVGMPKDGYRGPKPETTSTLYSSKSIRPRTFALARFNALIAELSARAGTTLDTRTRRRPAELLMWLRAGLASGLRPVEWELARWHDKEARQLLVRTAKRKLGENALPNLKGMPAPSHQDRIVTIDAQDVIWVDQHMAAVKRHLQSGEPFSAYYNNNRIYLWSICRELFGEKPPFTLYLMRGQFAANKKKLASPQDVAAMMGCAPHVASTYYGKKRYAHRSAIKDTQGQNEKSAPKPGRERFGFARAPQPAGGEQGSR